MSGNHRWSFIRMKAVGTLAYWVVRPFPVPFSSPGTIRYQLSARLWGLAYTAGAFPTLASWIEYNGGVHE